MMHENIARKFNPDNLDERDEDKPSYMRMYFLIFISLIKKNVFCFHPNWKPVISKLQNLQQIELEKGLKIMD